MDYYNMMNQYGYTKLVHADYIDDFLASGWAFTLDDEE